MDLPKLSEISAAMKLQFQNEFRATPNIFSQLGVSEEDYICSRAPDALGGGGIGQANTSYKSYTNITPSPHSMNRMHRLDVAIATGKAGKIDEWLRVHQLGSDTRERCGRFVLDGKLSN